jgi:hypothetical protein
MLDQLLLMEPNNYRLISKTVLANTLARWVSSQNLETLVFALKDVLIRSVSMKS